MFGIQPWHIIVIVIVALVIFGPGRLPGLGRSIGKFRGNSVLARVR